MRASEKEKRARSYFPGDAERFARAEAERADILRRKKKLDKKLRSVLDSLAGDAETKSLLDMLGMEKGIERDILRARLSAGANKDVALAAEMSLVSDALGARASALRTRRGSGVSPLAENEMEEGLKSRAVSEPAPRDELKGAAAVVRFTESLSERLLPVDRNNLLVGFDRASYADALVEFRRELLEEEKKSFLEGKEFHFNVKNLPSWEKYLKLDDALSRAAVSDDERVRRAAENERNLAWRDACARSSAERVEELSKLDERKYIEFARRRAAASREWLKQAEHGTNAMFGRPDNMLGFYLLAAMLPGTAFLMALPLLLPAFKGLLDAGLSRGGGRAATLTIERKKTLEEEIAENFVSASVLRALGAAGERHGLSQAEIYNLYASQLAAPDSVLEKSRAIVTSPDFMRGGVERISSLCAPVVEAARGLDATGAFLDTKISFKDGVLECRVPASSLLAPDAAEKEMKSITDSVEEAGKNVRTGDFSRYTVAEKAGQSASYRPGEAALLVKAIAAAWPDSSEGKCALYSDMYLRTLPGGATSGLTSPEAFSRMRDATLRAYGDCSRVEAPNGSDASAFRVVKDATGMSPEELKNVRIGDKMLLQGSPSLTDEQLRKAPLEHMIAAASEGRADAQREIARRARDESERLRQELVSLSQRMTAEHVRKTEEKELAGKNEKSEQPPTARTLSVPGPGPAESWKPIHGKDYAAQDAENALGRLLSKDIAYLAAVRPSIIVQASAEPSENEERKKKRKEPAPLSPFSR